MRTVLTAPNPNNLRGNNYLFNLHHPMERYNVRPLTLRSALAGADIAHVHWPEYGLSKHFSKPVVAARLIRLEVLFSLRTARNIPLVWTVHNIIPHSVLESQVLAKLRDLLASHVSGLIFHSRAMHEVFVKEAPNFQEHTWSVVRHPRYQASVMSPGAETSPPFALIFGTIRSNKNIDTFVKLLTTHNHPPIRLVGSCIDTDLHERIQQLAACLPNLCYRNAVLEDRDLDTLIQAARAIVVPYAPAGSSGVIIHALSMGKPVFALTNPENKELDGLVRGLRLFDTQRELLQELTTAWPALSDFEAELPEDFLPKNCALLTEQFYDGLIAKKAPRDIAPLGG